MPVGSKAIAALLAVSVLTGSGQAVAAWPERPVRLVVSFPAGSSTDIPGRIVAQHLSTRLGQPVVIDNVAGAAGSIGARTIARAAPDGYTIGLASSSAFSIAPSLRKNLPYDPIKDFAPLSLIGRSPYVIVATPELHINSLSDLIAYARAHPDAVNYGSAGAGSQTHLATVMLAAMTDTKLYHVPYKTSAAAVSDLLTGRIQFQLAGAASALQLIASGAVPLAVTGRSRLVSMPKLPTVAESGVPGFDVSFWLGIVAPAGTPPDIVEHLSREINSVLVMPEVRSALALQGLEAEGSTPAGFSLLINAEIDVWREAAKNAGMKPD